MNVYNIIWADDEIDDILSEVAVERLRKKGFEVLGAAHDGQELEEMLDEYEGRVDAVIVDANFNESSVEITNERDTSGLDYARHLYLFRLKKKVPFFLFTNRSDELLREIYNSNPKFLEDFPRHKRWFNKSGQGERDEMLDEIRAVVDEMATPEFYIRNKYLNELNACTLIDGAYDYFFDVLVRDFKGTLGDMKEPFIPVRRIIEKGFGLAERLALIPPVSSDINSTAAYLFHDCFKKGDVVLYDKLDKNLMPKPLAASLRYIVNITQDGAHSKSDLQLKVDEYFAETGDLNLLRSVVFAAMDFVKWLAVTAMTHRDPDMNRMELWKKVEPATDGGSKDDEEVKDSTETLENESK